MFWSGWGGNKRDNLASTLVATTEQAHQNLQKQVFPAIGRRLVFVYSTEDT